MPWPISHPWLESKNGALELSLRRFAPRYLEFVLRFIPHGTRSTHRMHDGFFVGGLFLVIWMRWTTAGPAPLGVFLELAGGNCYKGPQPGFGLQRIRPEVLKLLQGPTSLPKESAWQRSSPKPCFRFGHLSTLSAALGSSSRGSREDVLFRNGCEGQGS